MEAALLIEDHYDVICDEMWYIHTDASVRAERLKETRGYDDEKITSICANQKSPEEFRSACQVVIDNSGDLAGTQKQIDEQLGRKYEFMQHRQRKQRKLYLHRNAKMRNFD